MFKILLLAMLTGPLCAQTNDPTQPIEDCGIEQFLNQLMVDIYRVAEKADQKSSKDEVSQLLQETEDMIARVLSTCSPSAAAMEPMLHLVAGFGTPKMLEALKRSAHYNGCDNMAENNTAPIVTAAMYGNVDMVKSLHAEGADIHRTYPFVIANEPIALNEAACLIPAWVTRGQRNQAIMTGIAIAAIRYPGETPFSAFEQCHAYITRTRSKRS